MPALTTVKISADGPVYNWGTLARLPPELSTPAQTTFYRNTKLGWSVCPLGFDTHKFPVMDYQVVIPGIRLLGSPKPRRTFPDYSGRYGRETVESFAKELAENGELIKEESAALLANLTHDLRALSGQIYNAAELAKTNLIKMAYGAAMQQADDLLAAQQMLSLRLDMLDYSTGIALDKTPEAIPVYKKFDKIVKCFRPAALLNEIDLEILGPSQGYTFGPPVFELVPFVILENALKYSPKRSKVLVKVSDFDKYIDAHIVSFGPKIQNRETDRIFEQGFRGAAAEATGKSGSGIGLFAAHSLVRGSFGGELTVFQDKVAGEFGGKSFWSTRFHCRVPRVS